MNRDFRASHSHSRPSAAHAAGALLLAVALLLVACSTASAASGRPLLRSFSTGPASWPRDLTFDSADNLYVRDTDTNSAVAKYTTTGAPVPFAGGAPYIQGNKLFSPDGPGGNPAGYVYSIAVDASGGADDGYIYATTLYGPGGVSGVQVYDASGIFKGLLDPNGNGFPCGVAVNQATGEVYTGDFVNTPNATVRRYAPPVGDPSDDVPTGVLKFPAEGYSTDLSAEGRQQRQRLLQRQRLGSAGRRPPQIRSRPVRRRTRRVHPAQPLPGPRLGPRSRTGRRLLHRSR